MHLTSECSRHDPLIVQCIYRHMFLDAAIILRGQPQEHLLVTWAGLMQRPRSPGRSAPVAMDKLHSKASQMLDALESNSLITNLYGT